jgi:hypothetical protein
MSERVWFPRGWYRGSGSLRGTVVGFPGIALFFLTMFLSDDLHGVVTGLLIAVGFATLFAGFVLSVYDVVRPRIVVDPERRAWMAQHGDPDRRDDPADRPPTPQA